MACETHEELLLKKNLADLIDMIPIGGNFQVSPEQIVQMNNSLWTPMMRRVFTSDAKERAKEGLPARVLHNYKAPTAKELAKLDPTNTEYELFLKMKEWEKKEKVDPAKMTEAIKAANFVVGVMPEREDVRRQPLSQRAKFQHEENLLKAKDMIRLLHFLPQGEDAEADVEFWRNAVNEINSIIRGDYGVGGD